MTAECGVVKRCAREIKSGGDEVNLGAVIN